MPSRWPKGRFGGTLEGVPSARLLLVCGVAFALLACEGYVRRGSALYADGRYIEAAEVFERTEDRLTASSRREQAEYGLYRGMTLLVLGDVENARRWLAYAYEIERKNPGTLRPDRRTLLDRGWFELDHRSQREDRDPREPPDRAVASSRPQADLPSPKPERPPPGTVNERSLVPH